MGDFLSFNHSSAPGQLWAGFVSAEALEKPSTDSARSPARSLNLASPLGIAGWKIIPNKRRGCANTED